MPQSTILLLLLFLILLDGSSSATGSVVDETWCRTRCSSSRLLHLLLFDLLALLCGHRLTLAELLEKGLLLHCVVLLLLFLLLLLLLMSWLLLLLLLLGLFPSLVWHAFFFH